MTVLEYRPDAEVLANRIIGLKSMKTDDLFVPTSTGLAEHIPDLSGNAIKIYMFILLKAKMFDPEAGTFHKSITDLCSILKVSRSSFYKALKELSPKYLKIKPGKNECSSSKFKVYNPPKRISKRNRSVVEKREVEDD